MGLGCWRLAMLRGLLGWSAVDAVPERAADGATPNSAGRGSAYDYRPSPRQLRRSSPKSMMLRSLAEPRRPRGRVPVCETDGRKGTKSVPSHHEATLGSHCATLTTTT